MKFLLAAFFSISIAQAQHHSHNHGNDRKAVHGMLVVGASKIYLSHLPLFGSPHDYQVILEVELDPVSKAKYLESLATPRSGDDKESTIHTLVPEAFVLPERIREPGPLSAQLYRGHFERGGVSISDNVTLNIKRVIYFAKFEKNIPRDRSSRWILFGNRAEQFAAHLITNAPDFDQIFSGRVIGSVARQLESEGAIAGVSTVPNKPVVLSELPEGKLTLSSGGQSIDFSKLTELYLEEAELESSGL